MVLNRRALQILQISHSAPLSQEQSSEYSALSKALSQKKGVEGTSWAVQNENPTKAIIAISWLDKVYLTEYHTKLLQKLSKLSSHPKILNNDSIAVDQSPLSVFDAGAVEWVAWSFDSASVTATTERQVFDAFYEFSGPVSGSEYAECGVVCGWGDDLEEEGKAVKRFTSLIGWKSEQDHYDCKKTSLFSDNFVGMAKQDNISIHMEHYFLRPNKEVNSGRASA